MAPGSGALRCPICGSDRITERFAMKGIGTENGANAESFRPSADRFGTALGTVVACGACGHAFVREEPSAAKVSEAYANAADPVSLREEAGQVETARRALARIEQRIAPGRLCDLGCWTGSFLVAGKERGWDPIGVEP